MTEFERLKETHVSTKEIFDGDILHIIKDDILLPNNKPATREMILHVGAVCIVAVTDDNKLIMERQFRYPIGDVITEIPAGKLDSKMEEPLLAAKRELKEETGYTADTWTNLGIFYPAPAYSDEAITLFMARDLHKGDQNLDSDEFLDVSLIPIEDLVKEVMAGNIPDAKTQMGILRVARILGI